MGGVVLGQEALQEEVGALVIAHSLMAQQRAEALLQMAEASLDLPLGLWVRRHAMIDAQAQQRALELAARLDLGLRA